ncbi:homoserine kinase [Desulfatiferula olefinivorans]
MNLTTNIVLIGMPGVGKSTVGRLLAHDLGWDFLDTDALIVEKEGMALHDIIDRVGLSAFCTAEERAVLGIRARRTVISTGGSVVYGSSAMAHLKRLGTVIYLAADLDLLLTRFSDPDSRGVVRKPGQSLSSLLAERDLLYRRYADLILACPGGESPAATLARLRNILA